MASKDGPQSFFTSFYMLTIYSRAKYQALHTRRRTASQSLIPTTLLMTSLAPHQILKAFCLAFMMLTLHYESVCNKLVTILTAVAFWMCFSRAITPPSGSSGPTSGISMKSVPNRPKGYKLYYGYKWSIGVYGYL